MVWDWWVIRAADPVFDGVGLEQLTLCSMVWDWLVVRAADPVFDGVGLVGYKSS